MVAAVVAMVAGLPTAATALGGPVPPRPGILAPTWTGPAAFVHPGVEVPMPAEGRIIAVGPEGVVAAGATLAAYAPTGVAIKPVGLPAWARWDGGQGQMRPAPAGWVWAQRSSLALGVCLRRACAVAGGHSSAPAGPRTVVAPQPGWYFPGWDPLAALSAGAWSDLPPDAVKEAPVSLEPGMVLGAGASAGVLGGAWAGLWLLDLPALARPGLAVGAPAHVTWPAGGAGMDVRVARTGPTVAGHFLAALTADATGGAPGAPPRTTATLTLASVAGQWLPATALLGSGGAVAAVSPGGRPQRVAVAVLAVSPQLVAVSGLPAGERALARPWLVRPWLAGSD